MAHETGTGEVEPINRRAEYDTVYLNGVPIPVEGGIGESLLAAFDRKFTIGDPKADGDPYLSVWAQTDWSGGGQVRVLRSGTHQGRFNDGDLWTRDPNLLSLARLVQEFPFAGATEAYWPLGDLNGIYYDSADMNIRQWNEATETFTDTTRDLAAQPTNVSIEFAPDPDSPTELWVPHGALGYSRFDGSAAPTLDPSVQAASFAEWDDQLWVITADRYLLVWDPATAAWVDRFNVRLNPRHQPKHLVVYFNRADEPTLHVVTNRGLFAFDAGNGLGKFYPATVPNAPHPDHGLGADLWQVGGSLHYTVGMQALKYEIGATTSTFGLDRDDGVPAQFRGRFVALRGAANELWGLVRGDTQSAPPAEGFVHDSPGDEGGSLSFGAGAAVNSVWYYTGPGWVRAWAGEATTAEPTTLYVSSAQGAYRVWWGADQAYSVELPTDLHNPRTGLEAGLDRFQPSGELRTGRFTADMDGYQKLGSHVAFRVPRDGASATEAVTVHYRIDGGGESDWVPLGTVAQAGKTVLPMGVNADGFSEGVAFEDIEFKYAFARDPDNTLASPLVDAITFHFVKIPHNANAFVLSVPFHDDQVRHWFDDQTGAWTAQTLKAYVDSLIASDKFVKLTIGTRSWRVRLTQVTGSRATGQDDRGMRQISIIETRMEHDAPFGEVA